MLIERPGKVLFGPRTQNVRGKDVLALRRTGGADMSAEGQRG